MNTMTTEAESSSIDLLADVESACKKIPPLWPLKHFVAVNPFAGLSHMNFSEATRLVHRVAHGRMTLAPDDYARAFAAGEITPGDLDEAVREAGGQWTPESLHAALDGPGEEPLCFTVADALDKSGGSQWGTLITEEVSKWCAAYYDEGQALWRMPWRSLPLFRAWKRGAELDATPEVAGLPGFRASVQSLPDDALLAIEIIMEKIAPGPEGREELFHRHLMTVRGWAGYVQYRVREKEMRGAKDDSLAELLAIRLAYDYALHRAFGVQPTTPASQDSGIQPPALAVWQDALELAHRRRLLEVLTGEPSSHDHFARPDFQAVFCIDVRSEVFRRALESAAPRSETIGFAGFFGFPIEVVPLAHDHGAARCPVLLLPSHKVKEAGPDTHPERENAHEESLKKATIAAGIWKSFQTASITCFPFVETLGLAYVRDLVRDSLARKTQPTSPPAGYHVGSCGCGEGGADGHGIPEADRIAMAEGALRNMGLTKTFARVVLICGHGSRTANNPFGSSLDCGACGGHAGDANARVAAAVLNEPVVRQALAQKGIEIPADTVFVAGLHNTTTDEVEIFDGVHIPASHQPDLLSLQDALTAAGRIARDERSASLGLVGLPGERLRSAIEQRSRDWSEVRPEWGLAGNRAFIAAPRKRTKALDLGGRAFLHNYDHTRDPESRTLELILCAPMVVANWINLQYFGSAANNPHFGSGNKVLHNVVARIGVLEGNGGDLKTGLPWQSVHNGKQLAHTPLRLNAFIEAPRARIDAALARHEGVCQLVENHWLHLHAIENNTIFRRLPDGKWREENRQV